MRIGRIVLLVFTVVTVTGTPTFFIETEKDGFIKLVGAQPYATFQNIIDDQLG